jgi:hypothetical protein
MYLSGGQVGGAGASRRREFIVPPAPKNKNGLFIDRETPISLYIFRVVWTVKVVVFLGFYGAAKKRT